MTSVSPVVALARAAHLEPGISRAAAAHVLGMGSGVAAEATARLVAIRVLDEAPAPPSGRRGRPTTLLVPHPEGPLVAVASLSAERWEVCAVGLGGAVVASTVRSHRRSLPAVRRALVAHLDQLRERFGPRIAATVASVPGTVAGTRLVQAPGLGWEDVELSGLAPHPDLIREAPAASATSTATSGAGAGVRVGNDATFAGVAESRRGVAAGAGSSVHLFLDAGIGGAHLIGGRPVLGATGTAGEYGHMPFGDPALRCACGAGGCWGRTLDGDAVAALLGQPPPPDQVGFTLEVMAAAEAGWGPELEALRRVAASLGRGAAGLVNALDPEVVTVGGLGRRLLDLAGAEAQAAYLGGLMSLRASAPPPLLAGSFDERGPVVGAAEEGFDDILNDDGLRRWAAGLGGPPRTG